MNPKSCGISSSGIVIFVTSLERTIILDDPRPNDDGSDSRSRNTVSRRTDNDGLSCAYANCPSTVASSRTPNFPQNGRSLFRSLLHGWSTRLNCIANHHPAGSGTGFRFLTKRVLISPELFTFSVPSSDNKNSNRGMVLLRRNVGRRFSESVFKSS
ncbi:uncharacterized protein LOC120424958 [Culex pipiens pallens]|uniref:uncharacterized protein LOC120424958 n=1 Tax=Culex pipiens pallens TaxID=42434 RepID=UPI0019535A15|nr:uncharacterized protein LOC120424958 [Culex pipiens pallens]